MHKTRQEKTPTGQGNHKTSARQDKAVILSQGKAQGKKLTLSKQNVFPSGVEFSEAYYRYEKKKEVKYPSWLGGLRQMALP